MRKQVRNALIVVAIGVAGFFLWRYLQKNWDQVRAFDWRLSPTGLAGTAVFVTASVLLAAEGWRRILRALGARVPLAETWQVWALAQNAKYVPGAVWPLAAKVALVRRHGVHGGVAVLSGLLELALIIGTALLLSLCSLPLQAGHWPVLEAEIAGIPAWGFGVVLAVLGLAALHPVFFQPLLRLMLRLARATDARVELRSRTVVGLVGWYCVSWILHAIGMAWFCTAAVPELGLEHWPALASAYVVALISGYLLGVVLPMGIGVQEAAFAALTAPLFPSPAIPVVLSLATRLALAVCELIALAVAAGKRSAQRSGQGGR